MSTIRSLSTGMLPIGSTTMTPSGAVLEGLVEVDVAGEVRLAVDAHAARAADRGATGAADADRAVLTVLGLQDAVEHRAVPVEVDLEVLPVRGLAGLGRVAADRSVYSGIKDPEP